MISRFENGRILSRPKVLHAQVLADSHTHNKEMNP